MEVIDVTHWSRDEQHAIFPVGARDKEMLWSPDTGTLDGIKIRWPYLFKESIDYYPDQYWTEIVAFIVSKHLKVDVPKVVPAMKYSGDTVICGSLIEWFYDVGRERYMPAGSFFKRMIPDFDDKTGKQHNLHDMNTLIRTLSIKSELKTDRLNWLADMSLFDALIGNTDRHQENWGVVFEAEGASRLSPLFDNGTSLGHERVLSKVRQWDDNRFAAYINKGYHHLRITRDDTGTRIQLFELLRAIAIADLNRNMNEYLQQKLANLDPVGMLAEIESLTEIEIDIPFTKERYEWIKKILVYRLKNAKSCLDG